MYHLPPTQMQTMSIIDNNPTQAPGAAANSNKPANDPHIRRPPIPEQPLQARPPAPMFQLSRAGSQFGFNAPAANRNGGTSQAASEHDQVPARESCPSTRKSCKLIHTLNFTDLTSKCTHIRLSELEPGAGTAKPDTPGTQLGGDVQTCGHPS